MLKKLYKHELKALIRWIKFIWIALIGIAILNRVSTLIYNNMLINAHNSNLSETVLRMVGSLKTSIMVLHGIAIIAGAIATTAIVVVRFYKSVFSNEAYFTFSIPVKPVSHLWCKLLSALLVLLITYVSITLSLCILLIGEAGVGDAFVEIMHAFSEIWKMVSESGNAIHMVLFIIELLIIMVASGVSSVLTFYASMSIGQSFKNRVAGSIICYFIINIVLSALTNVLSFIYSLFFVGLIESKNIIFVHLTFIFIALYSVGTCVAFFMITNNRISKKLNLE